QGDEEATILDELAATHFRLARIHDLIGSRSDAESYYRKALNGLEKLARQHADVAQYRRSAATCCINLGILDSASGRVEDAEASYRRALEYQGGLVPDDGGAGLRYEIAATYLNSGVLYRATGRPFRSEEATSRAFELLESITRSHPDVEK